MINQLKSALIVSTALASLTSCSTIVNGVNQSVAISSNPANAQIWVDRAYVGNTPTIVEMTRKDNHVVTIALEGFETYEAIFSRKLSKWVFGNIIVGGIIGFAIDAVTGAMYTLTPDQIQAELCQCQIVHSHKSNDTYIAVVLQADPSWTKVGNLVPTN